MVPPYWVKAEKSAACLLLSPGVLVAVVWHRQLHASHMPGIQKIAMYCLYCRVVVLQGLRQTPTTSRMKTSRPCFQLPTRSTTTGVCVCAPRGYIALNQRQHQQDRCFDPLCLPPAAATGWASAWRAPAPSLRGWMAGRAGRIPPMCTTTCMPSVSGQAGCPGYPRCRAALLSSCPAGTLPCCRTAVLPLLFIGKAKRQGSASPLLHCSPNHRLPLVPPAGALNFTGDMPICLMVDGPSLGGFVCPATITTTELWKMGQVRPGDAVQFKKLSIEEVR